MSRTRGADLALVGGVIALGLLLLFGISDISFGAGYDRIGPRFFPYFVGTGLIALGGAMAVSSWRGRHRAREKDITAAPRIALLPLVYIALGLLLYVGLLEPAGFLVASSIQFWLVAQAFHSRRPYRDAIVAILLAGSVYVVFSAGLGLTLPPGIFGNIF